MQINRALIAICLAGASAPALAFVAAAPVLPPPVTRWSMTLSNAATGETATSAGSGAGVHRGTVALGRSLTNTAFGPVPFAAAVLDGASSGGVSGAPYTYGEAQASLTYSYALIASNQATFDAVLSHLLLHPGANGVGIGVTISGYLGVGVTGQGLAQASVDGGLGSANVVTSQCDTATPSACGVTAFTTFGGLVPDAATLRFSGAVSLSARVWQFDGGRAYAWADPYISYHIEELTPPLASDAFFKLAFSVPIVNATDPDLGEGAHPTYDPEIPGDDGEVPEPASWALMVSGFGLIGASLRRRRLA